MKLYVYIIIASLCVASIMTGSIGCGEKGGGVLAIVGNRKITTKDFNRALRNLPENYKILAESYKGKHKILDNLVKKELLLIEAERRGYPRESAVKKKIDDARKNKQKDLDQRIADLQEQRGYMAQQVYENVLLSELNTRLKKEGLPGVEITQEQVKEYYQDYARKLKILNPAAKAPKQEKVAGQIKAILIEEQLIKQLEKQSSVEIKESLFREFYGTKDDGIVIEDVE